MNRILILDTSQITVWAYPRLRIVHHQMKTHCHGAEFREALLGVIDAMERYRAPKYLSDNRAGAAVIAADSEWAGKVWFPRAQVVGWSHWAVVQPANLIGQLSLNRHATQTATNPGIDARVFSDPDEAMKWLVESD